MNEQNYMCTRPEDNGCQYHEHSTCTHYVHTWRGQKLNLNKTEKLANLYVRCDYTDDSGKCHNLEEIAARVLDCI